VADTKASGIPASTSVTLALPPRGSFARVRQHLEASGYTVAGGERQRWDDFYFDSHAGQLTRRGRAVRRREPGACLQLLEGGAVIAEGGEGPGPLAGQLTALDLEGPLLFQLRVRVEETNWLIGRAPTTAFVASCARWRFRSPRGGREERGPSTLTLRCDAAEPRELAALLTVLRDLGGLVPVDFDPVRSGLDRLALPQPGAPIPPRLRVAVAKILAQQAYKLRANLDGAVTDLDPEYVHDMRVATRRARFALRRFAPVLAPEAVVEVRESLATLGAQLGAVRDLDVFLSHLPVALDRIAAPPAFRRWLRRTLRRRRTRSRDDLLAALAPAAFTALVSRLESMPAHAGEALRPAREAAPAQIRRAGKKVLRLADKPPASLTDGELHALRIACKGLRYTCEFFADLYDDGFATRIRALVAVQDCLGTHQDAVIAAEALAQLATQLSSRSTWRDTALLAIGALRQLERERARAERERYADLGARVPGVVRKLRRASPLPGGPPDSVPEPATDGQDG
jgi:CHAD domain-containing protein